jgi:protein-tyrosine phosphatase
MIDIHSHILPEIDDGARSLEEALQMAQIAAADGIQQMVCTPHMFNGISSNPEPAEVSERVSAFQTAVGSAGLQLLPGNEVHITHEITEQAAANRVTRLNNRNYMLVEFPAMTVPVGAEELFDGLKRIGVQPILVHPERNLRLQTRPSMVAAFIQRGIYIQVTAMSLTGEFGAAARNCAEELLRHNCVHFLATDAHRPERRPPILSKGRDAAAEILGAEGAQRLVWDNPLAVITGRDIDAGPPIPWVMRADKPRSFFFGRFFRTGS